MLADPRGFIRQNTALLAPPLVPELKLHLAHEALPLWEKTEEELGEIGLPPPYWAFAWAGGQALARYVLDNPTRSPAAACSTSRPARGWSRIAAMQAGARMPRLASEIDAVALAAIAMNAEANGVSLADDGADLIGRDEAGTSCSPATSSTKSRSPTGCCRGCEALARRGANVLVGDPGRSYFPKSGLTRLATYEVPVTRALEDAEIKTTSVWRCVSRR